MKKLLILSLIPLVAGACAGGWNAEDKAAFMQSCRAGASRWSISPEMEDSYCYCLLDKTMQHYKTIREVVINKDSTELNAEGLHCKQMAGAE